MRRLFVGFSAGFFSPFRGFGYLHRRPHLWPYAVLPSILNLIVTLFVLVVFASSVTWMLAHWNPSSLWEPTSWWFVWLDWILDTIFVIVAGLVVIVASAVVAIIVWMLLQAILLGFFYSKLAEKVEQEMGVAEGELQEVSIPKQIVDALRSVGLLLTVLTIGLAVQILPVVGSVVGVVVGTYCNWLLMGIEYWSYPLDLRGFRWADKVAYARKHRGCTMGLGAITLVMAMLPIVGSVLLTTAVVGAVQLRRDLEDDAPPPGGVLDQDAPVGHLRNSLPQAQVE